MSFRAKTEWFASLLAAAALCGACGGNDRDASGGSGAAAGNGGNAPADAGDIGGSIESGRATGGYGPTGGASGMDDATGAGGGAPGSSGLPSAFRCVAPCPDSGPRPVPTARPKCPASQPLPGASCEDQGLLCSYGDAPTLECRSVYACSTQGDGGAVWVTNESVGPPCGGPLPEGYCPTSPPERASPCTVAVDGIPCVYGTLLCFCNALESRTAGSPGVWFCEGPPVDPECPASLPNLGEGCETQALECYYAFNACSEPFAELFCYKGAWEPAPPVFEATCK